jgi:hypothetical protein
VLTQRDILLPTSIADPSLSLHDILHGPSTPQVPASAPAPMVSAPTSPAMPLSLSSHIPVTSHSLHVPPTVALLAAPRPPAPRGPPSRQPRITQQLDPLWMSDITTWAQIEVDAQKIAERWQEMEKETRQWFCLHFFPQVCHSVYLWYSYTNELFSYTGQCPCSEPVDRQLPLLSTVSFVR